VKSFSAESGRSFVLLPLLLGIYITISYTAQSHMAVEQRVLSPALPTRALELVGHSYLKQFIAEALFIKTAVYYGGLEAAPDVASLDVMVQHFKAMHRLHPLMLDIYYRSEGVLAHRGIKYVSAANDILREGRKALPDVVALPFFEGFNYDRYLNQPARAAVILREASEIKGSPRWIGHLASLLAAEGGNIRSGLVWLKGMQASSDEQAVKERYQKEIDIFERAFLVQLALEQYIGNTGMPPATLDALVPGYIGRIPQLDQGYHLDYRRPNLFLKRDRS